MSTTEPPLGVTAVMLPELEFDDQLALCQRLQLTHYSWRPRIVPDNQRDQDYSPWGRHAFDLTPDRLAREGETLRRRLASAGLISFGTLPAATSDQADDALKLHFEGAAAVGAGRVRVAPEAYPIDVPMDYESTLSRMVDRYGQIIDLAQPYGLKIVLETHTGSLVASPALARNLCQPFSADRIGVIFDINNYMIEGGLLPTLAVGVIRRYIDHCHVGGARLTDETPRDPWGFRRTVHAMCPLTEADQNIPDWIAALRTADVSVPLIIENFTPDTTGAARLEASVAQLRPVLAARATAS